MLRGHPIGEVVQAFNDVPMNLVILHGVCFSLTLEWMCVLMLNIKWNPSRPPCIKSAIDQLLVVPC